MIFRGFGLRSTLLAKLKPWLSLEPRLFHDVKHNQEKKQFFVILDKFDSTFLVLDFIFNRPLSMLLFYFFLEQAVLRYLIKGKIMDLYSINVPKSHKGRGIARLLTDTAFTYAIVNDFFLFLTCTYTQKYYLANKNAQLSKRIVGPKSVLNTKVSLDSDFLDSLPDPEDPAKTTKGK